MRLAWLVALAGCGRVGFDARGDGGAVGGDAALDAPFDAIDAPIQVQPIVAKGVFASGASELRHQPAAVTNRRVFTFATWYRSANTGTMLLGAGTTSSAQSFLWASQTDGLVGFEHSPGGPNYAAYPDRTVSPWTYSNQWVHLVVAVDLTQADPSMRVRWWWNGQPRVVTSLTAMPFPQNLDLFLGSTVIHTLGNKWQGGFDWTGELAETYLIWGHALDASAFVGTIAPGVVRSVAYTGPVTPESVHFDYVMPGQNRFSGQPNWLVTQVASSTTALPY